MTIRAKPSQKSRIPAAGIEHGSGLPAKVGTRSGTFTYGMPKESNFAKSKPPRKMN